MTAESKHPPGLLRATRALYPCLLCSLLTACAATPTMYQAGPEMLGAQSVEHFEEYLEQTRKVVDQNLEPVEGFTREQQVQWNLPFRQLAAEHCSRDDTTGVLLIHGLGDSPFIFRDLARVLAANCIEVRTLLLQGHGTRPGDMVQADAEVWQAQVQQHFGALAGDVDQAFIGGFSLGGSLATDYALSGQQPTPAGLVAIAPAWQLNGLTHYLWLAPMAGLFADFLREETELNPVKYETVAINSGTQIARVLSTTQERVEQNPEITLPLYLVASEADSVINLDYLAKQFSQRFVASQNRMIVYRNLRNPWPNEPDDTRVRSLNSYLPQHNILEFSHQSLPIAPDNELYGLGAPLQRCLEPNNISLAKCRELPDEELWFSAWHYRDRPVYTSRLTYNPYFEELAGGIVGFILGGLPD